MGDGNTTLAEDVALAMGESSPWSEGDLRRAREMYSKLLEIFAKKRDALHFPMQVNLLRKQGYKVTTIMDKIEEKPFPSNMKLLSTDQLGDLMLFYTARREFMVNQIDHYDVSVRVVAEIEELTEASVRKELRAAGHAQSMIPQLTKSHPLVSMVRCLVQEWRAERDSLSRRIAQMDSNVSTLSRELTRRRPDRNFR